MRPVCILALFALALPGAALAQGEGAPQTPAQPPAAELSEAIRLAETPQEVIPDSDAPVMTLQELLARAERPDGNYDLVQLREQFEQANNAVQRAWSLLLPQVNVAATYTRNSTEAVIPFPNFAAGFVEGPDGGLLPAELMEISVQRQDQFGVLAQATMPLLVMPAYYGIAAANKAVEATHLQTTFARNELFLAISQAYYGAVASRRLIEVAYQQVQSNIEQERVARARYEVGEVPKVGWLRASVARSQAEQDLVRARNSFVSAKLALQALTGVTERFDVLPPEEVEVPEASVDALVRSGLENRKDLQASRSQVELADRALKAAWWQFAPVISSQGQLTWANVEGFTGSNVNWNVQLVASLNVFDGLRRYADLKDARSRLRQAEAARANLAREVIRDVKTSLLDLESARANLIQARSQAALASENADLVQAQYEAGVATYLDVTDALNARFGAEVAVVTEQLNVQVASLRLSRAIGRYGVASFP